jgi:ribosomal RNA-processing protein 17
MLKRSNERMAPQTLVCQIFLALPSNVFQPFYCSDDEPNRTTSQGKGDPEEMEFSDEEQLATVTIVEDFDLVDPTSTSHPSAQFASDEEQQSQSKTRKPIQPAQVNAVAEALRPSKPKFAYETKAARKYEKKKQAARRDERARLAKGRQKGKKNGKRL